MTRVFLYIFLLGLFSASSAAQTDRAFLLAVEDVFSISGRGTVATGKIERGSVKVGDAVEVIGPNGVTPTTVTSIEIFRKVLTEAKAGDNVGLLLRGVEKTAIERGSVIAKPGSIKTYKRFKARVDVLTTAEGGRAKPLPNGFRPLIEIRTGGFSGVLKLPAGKAEAAQGEKGVEVEIELTQAAPIEKGTVIAFREYGKTVAKGTVTALIPTK
jgi:elongation factor Tu